MIEPSAFQLVYWHWFVLAALLGTVEILAPGVFFLWLAVAALVTGILAFIIPGSGDAFQLISFSLLSMAMVFMAWKYIKKSPAESDQPLLNQRAAQYVGKMCTLDTAIVNGSGRVKLGDATWKVEGEDMPAGTQVRIVGFDGPVFRVERT